MSASAQDLPPLFAPPGMNTNDNWFALDGDVTHAFFLQRPDHGGDAATGFPNVGHATSRDLWHWEDHGTALFPIRGTWNDISIATGSIARHDGKWWMAYTARGSKVSGVGMAVSDDLFRWEKVGDRPVVPCGKVHEAIWEGKPVRWVFLADPYLFPEPVDGWYWMALNSRDVDAPVPEAGCVTLMRSRDMMNWESAAVMAYPKWFERLETPQMWEHGGRWYLYFGGAHDEGIPEIYTEMTGITRMPARVNAVFIGETLEGPYRPVGDWKLDIPGAPWWYIAKVLPGPGGREAMIVTAQGRISWPYAVSYAEDGSVVVEGTLPYPGRE